MGQDRVIRRRGAFVGGAFVALGLVETAIRLDDDQAAIAFWFPALCGGGALVLLGVFRVLHPPWASVALVTLGGLAGKLATVWTIIGPLSIALIVLVGRRSGREQAT